MWYNVILHGKFRATGAVVFSTIKSIIQKQMLASAKRISFEFA